MVKRVKLSVDQISILEALFDTKKGSTKELARFQSIFMQEKNIDPEFIKKITGLKKSAISKWRSKFIKGGVSALR